MNKETFCAFPFNTVFLGSDGGIKTCCSASKNLGNINESPIQDILQGKLAKEIRQYIIDEKWHENCLQCKKLESYGARSERISTLSSFDEYSNVTSETFIPVMLDFRWSNTCNLACNYCYEYFSSRWAQMKGLKVNANKEHAEESLFVFIEENKNTIRDINLLGGEPLLQKQNLRLFDSLPNQKYYVLTNLSTDVMNNKVADKILTLPNIYWGLSFDTVGDRFEYVRHGANWKKLNENISYIREKGIKGLNAHPLYCTYSAFNLNEYFDYILEKNAFDQIYWCALHNIDGLNVFSLPYHMKELAIKKLEEAITSYRHTKFDMSALENIKNNLIEKLDEYNKKSIAEKHKQDFEENKAKSSFIEWTKDVEQMQGNKIHTFSDLWPEVYSMLL